MTNATHYSADSTPSSSAFLSRGTAQYGLPMPIGEEGGDGDCYPNEDNETGP